MDDNQQYVYFNPPKSSKTSLLLLLLNIAFFSVLILEAAILYINRQTKVKEVSKQENFSIPTPNYNLQNNIDQWENKISSVPEIFKEKQVSFNAEKNDYFVRIGGTIKKIISPLQEYTIELFTGETINVSLNLKTFIGKARFGYNSQGSLVSTNFLPILASNLSELQTQQIVSIGYFQKDVSKKSTPLTEFVIFDSK